MEIITGGPLEKNNSEERERRDDIEFLMLLENVLHELANKDRDLTCKKLYEEDVTGDKLVKDKAEKIYEYVIEPKLLRVTASKKAFRKALKKHTEDKDERVSLLSRIFKI